MDVQGYDQIVRVATPPTLPSKDGQYAFSESNGRLYRYYGSSWEMVPNQAEITANARKGYVTGVMKAGLMPYLARTTSSNGTVTFNLTNTSTGAAAFSEVYEDGISISPYGNANAYQVGSPVLSADKKTLTANITQTGSVLLGLVSMTTAANGIDCRAIVMGKE